MSCLVCMGATMQCTFGAAPSTLVVIPKLPVTVPAMPVATVMDHLPIANIPPFGMCMSPANPLVAAATAAALGVLTPMPCVPATAAPWAPGSPTVLLGGMPVLDQTSKAICNWGGVINVLSPGQFKTLLP